MEKIRKMLNSSSVYTYIHIIYTHACIFSVSVSLYLIHGWISPQREKERGREPKAQLKFISMLVILLRIFTIAIFKMEQRHLVDCCCCCCCQFFFLFGITSFNRNVCLDAQTDAYNVYQCLCNVASKLKYSTKTILENHHRQKHLFKTY